ncbi:MAG: transglycosylase SLT domain-containing protein [Gemmobacter sp.]
MLRTLLLALLLLSAPPAGATPLAEALARAAVRDWAAAAEHAAPAGPVAADVVEWLRLRSDAAAPAEVLAFAARRPDWPALDHVRQRAEARLEGLPAAEVLAFFDGTDPATGAGLLALAAALRSEGRGDEAVALLTRLWPELSLSAEDQAALVAAEGAALSARHPARAEALLWAGRLAEAHRMVPLLSADWQRLVEAVLALREDRSGVDAQVAAVPASLADHPLLAHARFDWRSRKGRTDAALEILADRSADPSRLGRAEAWAGRRAVLARAAMRAGRTAEAWRIAASHGLTGGAAYADLEFLAGWAALRGMQDPDRALNHFEALGKAVSTPISVSRAEYWQGRAHEAAGRSAEAEASYRRGAAHLTAYYGLLSAERIGAPLDPAALGPPDLPDWRQAGFFGSSLTQAALLLHQAGDTGLARRFLLHLAAGLEVGDLAGLGALALDLGDAHLAVLLGKMAAARGVILPGLYFPDPAILPDGLAVPRPLALSIARRESEFRIDAVSPAGALGLMQLMPGTAKLMADKLGLPHDVPRLTVDPAYNAALGSAYLAHLEQEFGPSLALVAAGYNAGPGRPRAWVADLGDPRSPATDVVDWVEQVPFAETRTYIMRVAEGVAIYRALAAGQPQPVRLTDLLAGRD